MRKTGLFFRFVSAFIILVLFSVLGLAGIAFHISTESIYRQTHEQLSILITLTARHLDEYSLHTLNPDVDSELENLFTDLEQRLTIIAADGIVLADSVADAVELENHLSRPEIQDAIKFGSGTAKRYSVSIHRDLYYLAQAQTLKDGTVVVYRASTPLPRLEERLNSLYFQLFWGSLVVLGIASFVSFALARQISQPLARLAAAARQIGNGNLKTRTVIHSPTELKTLSDTMNAMAAELEQRIEDIERRRQEAEAILGGLQEGVILLDRKLRVTMANTAAQRILGSSGTVGGKSVLEAFKVAEFGSLAEHILSGGTEQECELSVWRKEPIHLRVYADRVEGRDACLIVFHDISRIVQLEKVRKDFVANVSHELRTPVTSIKGFAETLLDGAMHEEESLQRYLHVIHKQAGRLEQIVEDLLCLARLEQQDGGQLEFDILDINSCVKDVLEVCAGAASQKNITISVDLALDVKIRARSSLIEQALVNLVDNAIKYSPEGSHVRISGTVQEDTLRIAVQDSGPGIPEKDIERIFERFYRIDKARSREAGGTGLGLAIVKHIVKLHNGTVYAQSEQGNGSTFTILLPLSP